MVDAEVPRSVHPVDLVAYVVQMTVVGVREPNLAHRVVASSAVGVRPYEQNDTSGRIVERCKLGKELCMDVHSIDLLSHYSCTQ